MYEVEDKDKQMMERVAEVRDRLVKRTRELVSESTVEEMESLKTASGARTDGEFMEILHLVVLMVDEEAWEKWDEAEYEYWGGK